MIPLYPDKLTRMGSPSPWFAINSIQKQKSNNKIMLNMSV